MVSNLSLMVFCKPTSPDDVDADLENRNRYILADVIFRIAILENSFYSSQNIWKTRSLSDRRSEDVDFQAVWRVWKFLILSFRRCFRIEWEKTNRMVYSKSSAAWKKRELFLFENAEIFSFHFTGYWKFIFEGTYTIIYQTVPHTSLSAAVKTESWKIHANFFCDVFHGLLWH